MIFVNVKYIEHGSTTFVYPYEGNYDQVIIECDSFIESDSVIEISITMKNKEITYEELKILNLLSE